MSATAWRLIVGSEDGAPAGNVPGAFTGARNMAVDQALLESVAAGAPPVLRLYRWRPACLSFGRNQAAAGIYDEPRARLLGIDIVRRPTGGLSVLHDAELTYAVVAPAAMLGGPRAAYYAINRALAMGLQDLGIPAELAGGARRTSVTAAFRGAQPCFALPAGGEVVVNGRKLVGSAQRVERRTILQHGSILLDGSQATVQRLRCSDDGAPAIDVMATSVRELLGSQPAWADLTRAFSSAHERVFGTALAPADLRPEERARAGGLEARFAGHEWTWRR